MKRFAPIAAVAVGSLLLAGCQSKREICAQFAAYSLNSDEELNDFYKRLGIEQPMTETKSTNKVRQFEVYKEKQGTIERYCSYYKS